MKMTLFVSNQNKQQEAIDSFTEALAQCTGDEPLQLKVVDILESPNQAMMENAFATPMLMREPASLDRKVMVNLKDTSALCEKVKQLY